MVNRTKYILCVVFLLLGWCASSKAQELRCNIQLVTTQIQGSNKSVTDALQTALYEFVNTRIWTNNTFSTEERIECNMLINITDLTGNDFSGTIQIQSRRPVFNSIYNTTLLNFKDENLKFTYVEGQPLEFSETMFMSNLTSVIAFYVYIIIGLDYDSFSLNGGTAFYRQAEMIVNNAQQSSERGWKAFEGNNRNRYLMVQNLMDDRYRSAREFIYRYHRLGLDRMSDRPNEARSDMITDLQLLQDVFRRKPDPYLFLLQLINESKSDEWVNLFSSATPDEKTRAVKILKEIDISNASKYDRINQ